jgi:membrane protease YdiL (CAAX protease family)
VTRTNGQLACSLAGAYALFAKAFRGPRSRFWPRMTATGLTLGAVALTLEPGLRRTRIRARDVVLGAAAAAGLYGIFQAGDRIARRVMPAGSEEIGSIYALRELRPPAELAVRLGLVIAPTEELFWRGFVQRSLAAGVGPWPGAILGAAAYGGAHLATGNLTLTGAAGIAGAYWATLAAAGFPMGALIVSHILWDIWIFLVAPTGGPRVNRARPSTPVPA